MNKVACSAAIAAGLFAASASSASVVVYNGSNPSPSNYTQSANIFAGAFVSLTQNLLPGDTAQFIYTAITPLKIASIATRRPAPALDDPETKRATHEIAMSMPGIKHAARNNGLPTGYDARNVELRSR